MIIEGSVYGFFSAEGQHSLQLPESGLTIVGISISNVSMSVPLDPSHSAVFLGTGLGYYYYKVRYKMSSSQFSFTTSGAGALVTIYYGVPDAGNIPLSAYAGVLLPSVVFSIPASLTSFTAVSVTQNLSFPSGAVAITAVDEAIGGIPSGVSFIAGMEISIVSGTGKQLNMQLPLSPPDTPVLGGVVNSPSGLLPFDLRAALNVPVTLTVWATNSNTAASSFGLAAVVYYAYKE